MFFRHPLTLTLESSFCVILKASVMTTKVRKATPKPTNSETMPPPRQIGRIDDATWDEIKVAAFKSGRTFTEWATSILLHAAREKHKGFDLPKRTR